MNAPQFLRLLAFFVCASVSLAHASINGTVSGTLRFYENEGNFCPTTRNCTHANYLESQHNTNQPISDATVYLWDQTHSEYVGQGSTDENGDYNITYFSIFASIDVRLIWVPEHKDGRFKVLKLDETRYWMWATGPGVINSSTTLTGRDYTWGSAATPGEIPDTYTGAWRVWRYALKYSNVELTYFDDLKVIAYDPASSSSSASGVNNKVVLDTNSMYKPQARIMHEMGHIAEYLAAHGQARNGYPTANYCWGGEAAPCGHNFLSTEGESVVYVESIASFVADTALYWFSNPAPHSCNSVAACATGTYDVEASVGPGGCNGDGFDFRREVNGQRYFRDLFDDVNGDEAGVNIPHVSFGYILEANADFPEGTGNHQENEFSVSIDGKGLADYGWQFSANSVGGANSANESTLRTNNCAWSAF